MLHATAFSPGRTPVRVDGRLPVIHVADPTVTAPRTADEDLPTACIGTDNPVAVRAMMCHFKSQLATARTADRPHPGATNSLHKNAIAAGTIAEYARLCVISHTTVCRPARDSVSPCAQRCVVSRTTVCHLARDSVSSYARLCVVLRATLCRLACHGVSRCSRKRRPFTHASVTVRAGRRRLHPIGNRAWRPGGEPSFRRAARYPRGMTSRADTQVMGIRR